MTVGAVGIAQICDRISSDGTDGEFRWLASRQAELDRVLSATNAEMAAAFDGPGT